jgi:tetratricopeptide (TPR) repeat protein
MLDINDLEKRWLHYKLKSYIPYAIIVISLVIIISLLLFVFSSDQTPKQKQKKSEIQETVSLKEKTIKTEYSEPTIPEREATNNQSYTPNALKLEPSLGFMNKMQNSTQPYYNNDNSDQIITQNTNVYMKAPLQQKKQILQEEVIEQELEVVEDEIVQNTQKISIKRRNTKDDIAEIVRRFKKNNNPTLSLFIAKKYYDLGDYHQAYNYALITNNINSDIEQSWIVFAKSLVKLNEKDMAIKTLKSYIESSHSNTAKILLEEITSGKFR